MFVITAVKVLEKHRLEHEQSPPCIT